MRTISILFFLFTVLSPFPAGAQDQDPVSPDTVRVANAVVQAVFADLLKASRSYKDLAGLGPSNLAPGEHGISRIHYLQKSVPRPETNPALELGVAVVPMAQERAFNTNHPTFHFTFPFLGVKIVAYQVDNLKARQYNLAESIKVHGRLLMDHQREYMPFRMSIVPDRPEFETGETVGFTVRLTNHSNINLTVRRISERTLYLNIDGFEWGKSEPSTGGNYRDRVILKPGELVERHFNAGPYQSRGEISIYGSYNVTFENVEPSAMATVRIVPAPGS
jgi:hypothetical protein